jgi:riboflavin kinase/FMN adenylyltransferase
MRVIYSIAELGSPVPSAATVGNFDGVHRGHQAILATVAERAAQLGIRSLAMTFEPHPLKCIAPERAPLEISTLEQKVRLIEASGIDVLLVQTFSNDFSRVSAAAFIESFLVNAFHTRSLCVGHNFRFGQGHRGDIETLLAADAGFEVVEVPPVMMGASAISSSRIRGQILNGCVRDARRMLGRCYEIQGTVVSGKGRGRRIAAPTLNLDPDTRLLPADGVYLTRVAGVRAFFEDSLTNIGIRPTFGDSVRTIETHLLDGTPQEGTKEVRLRFVDRLREERKFPNAMALRAQIDRDRESARRFFRRLEQVRGRAVFEGATKDSCRRKKS